MLCRDFGQPLLPERAEGDAADAKVLNCFQVASTVNVHGMCGDIDGDGHCSNELNLRMRHQVVDCFHIILEELFYIYGPSLVEPSQGNRSKLVGNESPHAELIVGIDRVSPEQCTGV